MKKARSRAWDVVYGLLKCLHKECQFKVIKSLQSKAFDRSFEFAKTPCQFMPINADLAASRKMFYKKCLTRPCTFARLVAKTASANN